MSVKRSDEDSRTPEQRAADESALAAFEAGTFLGGRTKRLRVTEAAIKTPDGRIWTVPRPGRHDSVFARIFEEGDYPKPLNEIQGFVDEEGNFLTRAEAEVAARASGQLQGPVIGGVLTSEDLWNSWRCGYNVNERKVVGGCGAIYERPKRRHRLGERVNHARTTTCPNCGQVDALHATRH